MSKNTSNRSIFYKDSTAGTFTLVAKVAPKPDTVSASCALWADALASVIATLTQTITIGSSVAGGSLSNDDADSSPAQTQTGTQQAQTTTISNVGGAAETLHVEIQTEPVATAGAGSFFSASASDSSGAKGKGVRFLWNFGDGAIQEGQTVFHVYAYPGTYVVMLTASVPGDSAGIVRTSVEAAPARIGVLAESDGSVVLSNQSPYELNIGLWSITSGANSFSIPQDTILVGNARIQFAPSVMHMSVGEDVVLRYPNNAVVATAVPQSESQSPTQTLVKPAQQPLDRAKRDEAGSASASPQSAQPKKPSPDTSLVAAVGASHAPWPLWAWGLGVLGIVLIGLGAASYIVPRERLGWPFRHMDRKAETSGEDQEFEVE
ncbi:MAG TPA: PKD domain-containing protein [Candidatus Paceibacterota bacterium]|nr:PKD domain-containing protein [Candidatus Paceibacterota bacterium]